VKNAPHDAVWGFLSLAALAVVECMFRKIRAPRKVFPCRQLCRPLLKLGPDTLDRVCAQQQMQGRLFLFNRFDDCIGCALRIACLLALARCLPAVAA
jgi:hypothetical protein